jgi:hypothetical protein
MQHFDQFPRDRKTETCTAVFTAGGAIGLLERFEYQLLFVLRDSYSRIGN